MPASAPFFHLDALHAVLDGTASTATADTDSGALARSVFPLPFVTAGALMWPQEHAHRVLHEWAQWTRTLPANVTTVARLVRYPRLPGVPSRLRGRALVAVEVAIPGEPWVAEGRLATLRRLSPEVDTVVLTNPSGVPPMHLELDLPPAAIGRQVPLRRITAEVVDAFVAAAGPSSGSPLASAELRHLGGGACAVSAAGRPTGEEDRSRLSTWLDVVVARAGGHPTVAPDGHLQRA